MGRAYILFEDCGLVPVSWEIGHHKPESALPCHIMEVVGQDLNMLSGWCFAVQVWCQHHGKVG